MEKFSWKKLFTGFTDVLNPILWAKDIFSLINLRKLAIYAVIFISVYTYVSEKAYKKAINEKPVTVEWTYDKGVTIDLGDGEQLIKEKKDNKLYKYNIRSGEKTLIKIKDVPSLKKSLNPLQFKLEPIGIIGYNVWNDIGEDTNFEGGGGLSFLRYYRAHLDCFLTNCGVYGGVSYDLDSIGFENSALGVGFGAGYKKKEKRVLVYFRIKF